MSPVHALKFLKSFPGDFTVQPRVGTTAVKGNFGQLWCPPRKVEVAGDAKYIWENRGGIGFIKIRCLREGSIP